MWGWWSAARRAGSSKRVRESHPALADRKLTGEQAVRTHALAHNMAAHVPPVEPQYCGLQSALGAPGRHLSVKKVEYLGSRAAVQEGLELAEGERCQLCHAVHSPHDGSDVALRDAGDAAEYIPRRVLR